LLGNAERVVDLDTEIADSTLKLRVPETQLHSSEIAFSVRRIECVAYAELSRPARAPQRWTMRASCRIERCGCLRKRLGKRYFPLLAAALDSHSPRALRVCSVISNCTGRLIFFWITVARSGLSRQRTRLRL